MPRSTAFVIGCRPGQGGRSSAHADSRVAPACPPDLASRPSGAVCRLAQCRAGPQRPGERVLPPRRRLGAAAGRVQRRPSLRVRRRAQPRPASAASDVAAGIASAPAGRLPGRRRSLSPHGGLPGSAGTTRAGPGPGPGYATSPGRSRQGPAPGSGRGRGVSGRPVSVGGPTAPGRRPPRTPAPADGAGPSRPLEPAPPNPGRRAGPEAPPGPPPADAAPASAQSEPPARRSLAVSVALGAIRTYQLARTGRVSPCRFTPTCSQYALEAVELHGLRHGLALTARRLGRCRPGGPFGADPVPE